jgi:hypothetical protein
MKRALTYCLLLLLPNLLACQSFGKPQVVGAGANVVNTVPNTTIVSVRYNGQGVTSGGGESCCVSLPAQWQPGMMATIEWTKDPSPGVNPGGIKAPGRNLDGTSTPEWRRWMEIHKANYTYHSVTIPVPKYEKISSLKLIFLPCNQVYPLIDSKERSRVMGNLPGGDEWEREIIRRVGGKTKCPKS